MAGQPRTQQVEEDGAAVLGVGVRSEVDALLAEALQQLLAGAGQLHAHALHAVAQLRAHRLHDRDRAVLIQVHLHACMHALLDHRQSSSLHGHAMTLSYGRFLLHSYSP
jgi:hypothetical protein